MTSPGTFTITCGRCGVHNDRLAVEWAALWAALPCEQHRRTRGALWLPTLPRPEGFEEIPGWTGAVRWLIPSVITDGSEITFREEIRPVGTWRVTRHVHEQLIDDCPQTVPAVVDEILSELTEAIREHGCTYASDFRLSCDRDWNWPYPEPIDPRGRWRRAWDRLRCRPSWTPPPPPPPPYLLAGEIRCA